MAGRKPKPTALKKLEGNPGKRKLNTKKTIPQRVKAALVPYDVWEKQGYLLSTEASTCPLS